MNVAMSAQIVAITEDRFSIDLNDIDSMINPLRFRRKRNETYSKPYRLNINYQADLTEK